MINDSGLENNINFINIVLQLNCGADYNEERLIHYVLNLNNDDMKEISPENCSDWAFIINRNDNYQVYKKELMKHPIWKDAFDELMIKNIIE